MKKNKLFFSRWGLCLLAVLPFLSGCERHNFRREFAQAEENRLQGDYAAAAQMYGGLASSGMKHPEMPLVFLRLGHLENLHFNDPQKAGEYYNTLIRRWPDHEAAVLARERLAEMHALSLQYGQAAGLYQELLIQTTDPEDRSRYTFRVGENYYRAKDFAQVVAAFQPAIDRGSLGEYANQAQMLLGESYFMLGKPETALRVYETVLKSGPEKGIRIQAQFNKALCYEELGQYSKALAVFQSLLGKYPNPDVIEHKIRKLKTRRERAGRG